MERRLTAQRGDVMERTTHRAVVGNRGVIGAGVVMLGMSLAVVQAQAIAQEPPFYTVQEFGVVPRPVSPITLVQLDRVRSELGITDAQQKEQKAINEGRFQKMQEASRDIKDAAKLREVRTAILRETDAALQANLTPQQRERMDQIHIASCSTRPTITSTPPAGVTSRLPS
jgi:hypothetical protein